MSKTYIYLDKPFSKSFFFFQKKDFPVLCRASLKFVKKTHQFSKKFTNKKINDVQ